MHVQKVLDRLVECNLRINLSKCQWFQPEVEFLGHLITKETSLMRLRALMTRRMMLIMRRMKEKRMTKNEEWRDTVHIII